MAEHASDNEVSVAAPLEGRSLGTFEGVFTPTLLTILGVMMYLRTGWVVGEVGLLGAWAIIAGAAVITTATALSLSSVATNVKLGAGGPYGIIARSLGLEIGGSIGIPLYLSQAVAVTMYVFGLREGWQWIFPEHPALVVDIVVLLLVVGVSLISARVAFRLQYLIIAIIAASLASVFAAGIDPQADIEWWRPEVSSSSSHFWMVFAVFFPAVTGITAGANMSGELAQPNRSIPRGSLSAVAISTALYLFLAFWLARTASGDELRNNLTVLIDGSAFAPLVVAGLIGATLSSAINSFVGAPRILQALAAHRVIPLHRFLAHRSRGGEPRRAMLVTAVLVAAGLLLRDLNAIAPLLTMFFLITYAGVNAVVLLEQRLAVVSFRPRLRLPQVVPLVGFLGSILAMFVVSPVFGLIAVAAVVFIYRTLMRRHLAAPQVDVRSGAFRAIAEWAARRTSRLTYVGARSWRANLLLPVVEAEELWDEFPLVVDITVPYGSVTLIGVTKPGERARLQDRLALLRRDFMELGVHASSSVVEAVRPERGLAHAMQTLRTAFLRPNTILIRVGVSNVLDEHLHELLEEARASEMGAIIVAPFPTPMPTQGRIVNVWIHDQGPEWILDVGKARTNINLLVLLSYILRLRWRAEVRMVTAAPPEQQELAQAYLLELVEQARLPGDTRTVVTSGSIFEALSETEHAHVNLLGLPGTNELEFVKRASQASQSNCLFVRDSGQEDAFV